MESGVNQHWISNALVQIYVDFLERVLCKKSKNIEPKIFRWCHLTFSFDPTKDFNISGSFCGSKTQCNEHAIFTAIAIIAHYMPECVLHQISQMFCYIALNERLCVRFRWPFGVSNTTILLLWPQMSSFISFCQTSRGNLWSNLVIFFYVGLIIFYTISEITIVVVQVRQVRADSYTASFIDDEICIDLKWL